MSKSSKAALGIKVSLNNLSPSRRRKLELALSTGVMRLRKFCVSRGLTFPDDLELIFRGGRHYSFSRRRRLTNTQKQILHESGAWGCPRFLNMTAKDEHERRRTEKAKSAYNKVLFGGRCNSEQKKAAYEFLVCWGLEESLDAAYPQSNMFDRAA